jgi:hypothetical protein
MKRIAQWGLQTEGRDPSSIPLPPSSAVEECEPPMAAEDDDVDEAAQAP